MSFVRCLCVVLLAAFTAGPIDPPRASATPPAYLVLRRTEAPGPHHFPGQPDAALIDVPASGYAYGWFGAAPRKHSSRHFGYYRTYTQWSWW